MRRTIATKSGDRATTSDKWHFVLLRPVARDSPSAVKGALMRMQLYTWTAGVSVSHGTINHLSHGLFRQNPVSGWILMMRCLNGIAAKFLIKWEIWLRSKWKDIMSQDPHTGFCFYSVIFFTNIFPHQLFICDVLLDSIFEVKYTCFPTTWKLCKRSRKDPSCWSHDCLLSMATPPTHCDVTYLLIQRHLSFVTWQWMFTVM